MTEEKKILLLTDIIEQRLRKEKELEFYQEQLEEIKRKMWFLQKELDVTNTIMALIEQEKIAIVGSSNNDKNLLLEEIDNDIS
jgi:hypothetical protein